MWICINLIYPHLRTRHCSFGVSGLHFCFVVVNQANSSLPANSAFPLAGWSDGLECNAQVQEEVRHLSALQAYLSLGVVPRSDLREWPASPPCFRCFYCHSSPKPCTERSLLASSRQLAVGFLFTRLQFCLDGALHYCSSAFVCTCAHVCVCAGADRWEPDRQIRDWLNSLCASNCLRQLAKENKKCMHFTSVTTVVF